MLNKQKMPAAPLARTKKLKVQKYQSRLRHFQTEK